VPFGTLNQKKAQIMAPFFDLFGLDCTGQEDVDDGD